MILNADACFLCRVSKHTLRNEENKFPVQKYLLPEQISTKFQTHPHTNSFVGLAYIRAPHPKLGTGEARTCPNCMQQKKDNMVFLEGFALSGMAGRAKIMMF